MLGLAATFAVVAGAPDWKKAGDDWWTHIQYLASDDLEGRGVGTKGYEAAAHYVSDQFERAGLKPGNKNSYFQPVHFLQTTLDPSRSRLELIRDGKAKTIPVPAEAFLGGSSEASSVIKAPMVFAGYGLTIPEAHHDDLRELPIEGAVVVFITGGPDNIEGNLRSHYSSGEERWKAMKKAGAVGSISIPNPTSIEIPWSRLQTNWNQPQMIIAGESPTPGRLFSAAWNPDYADNLLAGSGHTFAEVLGAVKAQTPLPHFALASEVQAHVAVDKQPVESINVVGVLPGMDPELRSQSVVVSAHLDHLGKGVPVDGDSIYNGAMDDASGVASVVEIAKALAKGHQIMKRSVAFLAVTGEEKGELGSQAFATEPTLEGKVVADINMDMFLPLFPLRWLEVQGLNESTLGEDIRAVAGAAGVKVQADKEPNRNRFIRSDQYSFIKKGVPSLAFKFGFQKGDPEEKLFTAWYAQRYHGVKDDLSQPVDKEAAAQFNAILEQLAMKVANAPQAPAWKQESFFRRFALAAK